MFRIMNICGIQPRNLAVTFLLMSCLGHMWLSNADPNPANIEQTLDVGVCRSASEYLEAMYRCKQSEFQVVTVCKRNKQDTTPLSCPKLSRLAIYSAVFVEAADSPDAQSCATQTTPSSVHECLSNSCQLSQVERRCHGKQKCSLGPDVYVREPCVRPQFLNIIYICVTQKIFKELKGDNDSPDSFCEGQTSEMIPEVLSNKSANIVSASRDIRTTSTSVPPANHVLLGTSTQQTKTRQPDNSVHKNSRTARTAADDWYWAPMFIKDNKEKLMLYLLLSIFIGLFLVLLVIILRLCLDFQCGRPTEHHLANTSSIRKQSSPDSPDGGTPSNPNVELIRYTYSVTTPNDYNYSSQQQQQQQQQPQQQPHHQHYLYHTPPGSDGGKWTYNGGQPTVQTVDARRPPFSSAASSSGQDETDSATESRTLGRFYTNPYRHDSYRVDQMKTLQYRR